MSVDPEEHRQLERLDTAPGSLRPLSGIGLDDQTVWGLVDAAPDGIVLTDESGRILLVNSQTEQLFGYDRGELLGREVEELLPERFRQVHRAHRTRYRAEPRIRAMGAGLELRGRRSDGVEFPVEISLSPLASDQGLRMMAVVRDVTDRVDAEAQAREVRELLDATRDAVSIVDVASLRFKHVNQGLIDQVGYSREELLGMTMLHITPEFTAASLRDLLSSLERGDLQSMTFTTTHRHRDGADIPVEILLQVIPDEEGRPLGYVKIARNIQDRLETERLLRQAEGDLRLSDERDRIGRDLHDLVIQRLFAAGMSLQAMSTQIDRPEHRTRLGAVVDELDETIREIRTVILRLEDIGTGSGVRAEVLRILNQEQSALGFEPHLRCVGPIDSIPQQVADHLFPTLREALSNVARHAQASAASVLISVDEQLRLCVEDNGVGMADETRPGNGLRNAAARAAELGGTYRATPGSRGGTTLEWTVPLSQAAS